MTDSDDMFLTSEAGPRTIPILTSLPGAVAGLSVALECGDRWLVSPVE